LFSYLRNIIFFILVITVSSQDILSQYLNFHHYSTDDGLPQSTVYDIVQDSLGFIWFGTEAGLGRFDGVNVKTYNLNDGLVGNNIGVLFIDRLGSLWIGTNSGLSILFEDEVVSYTTSNGLPDDFIYGITEDADGNLWIATRYGGACKFIGKDIQIYNEDSGFPSNQLSGVFKDSNDNIWFTSLDKGLIKYNGTNFITYSVEDGLLSNTVTSIFEDSGGLLWIGTDKGVTTFNGKIFFQFSQKEGFPEEEISTIVEDSLGDIWLGLNSNGILRYDGRKIYKHYGLESNEIRTSFVDKRGDIWFGTFLGGLSRLPVDWFEIYSTNSGLRDKAVYPIAQDGNGKMFFGHYGKGVSVYNNENFSSLTTASGLISNDLSSILYDSQKNLWFGTLHGVSKFNKKLLKSYNGNNGLVLDEVLKIFEDSNGYIWFGAIGGVSKYDPNSDKIVEEFSTEHGFRNAWVNDIYEDEKGVLWFATHYSGLITYDGKTFNQIDTSDGLPINNIFSIMQDRNGIYWLGTDGKGICKYNGVEFVNITEKEGLTSDVAYFVIENKNELYIGTLNGISILTNNFDASNSEPQFRYLSKNEGIPSIELNQGAYFRDRDSYLWFGTQDGLIKIDPNKIVQNENLSVFLSDIIVSDGIDQKKYNSIIKEDLHYEQNNISFNFFSISFAKPDDTLFEFMLEGVEENWSKTSNNSVSYRALAPGSYNFWIKAKNNLNSEAEAKLLASFTIAAPFYKTWWFIISSIIIFILFIYSFYFYKTQQVKKRNEALEAMVKDRTSELEKEKNKSDELLHNILPASLVDELKVYGKVRPRRFNSVSIMFTDFKSFTYTTSVLPPEELVHELNDIFKKFDALIGKYGLEKLKTIGDSYMAACGIPSEMEDHAIRIIYAALDFQKMIKERNKTSPIKWEMRLGVHSGSVVAGVVGTKKFTYDIWGDTVNIASRMESSGEPGEINISGYTYMLIRDHFDCEYRGKVETKGKGSIDMYFVKGVNRNQITKQTANQTHIFKPSKPFKQIS
jgi:ligand-binding sensor domain-containing protein/class 3 adenylate cyclase